MKPNQKKISVGSGIHSKNARWSFGGQTAKYFQGHVEKSVPFYKDCHNLIAEFSEFFIKENSYCLDVGCSTGSLIRLLSKRHSRRVRWHGLEPEKEMMKIFKQTKPGNATLIPKRLENAKLTNKYDFIIAFCTMQFIRPSIRQQCYSKIYKKLNWGGGFILFEKVRAPDARFQDIVSQIYTEFKINQGFTKEQIVNKTKALKGVLEPFSTAGNLGLIKRAGFVDVTLIFKWLCFEGYLCIK